jgi:hypothetical protein
MSPARESVSAIADAVAISGTRLATSFITDVNPLESEMPDDLSNRGRPGRDRVNVNEEHELRNWAQSLGVTPERVKEAVQAVGDKADSVRQYLSGGRSGDSSSQSTPGRGRTGSDSGGSDRGAGDRSGGRGGGSRGGRDKP